MGQYLSLVRVYASLSARAAAPLGAPLFFGILVVAVIVFGPTGMRAADLVFTLRSAPAFAAVLWLGWIVLTLPVARLALIPPSSSYLRWLPAPRSILYFSAAMCGFVVELPWVILFARGENLLSGLSAGLSAIALHAAVVTRPVGLMHIVIGGIWAIAAFLPSPLFSPLSALAAGIAAFLAVKRAIDRAPEMQAMARSETRVQAPAMALARIHVLYVFRQEPAVVGRMLVLATLAGMSVPFAKRGFDVETPGEFGTLILGFAVASLTPAMSGVSASVIRSERLAAWLADVLGTSGRTRTIAAALAGAFLGLLGGVCLSLVAALGLRHWNGAVLVRILAIPMVWAGAVAVVMTSLARETEASPKRGDRGLISVLVVMVGGLVAGSWWGEWALGGLLVMAIGIGVMAPARWEILRRRRGIS